MKSSRGFKIGAVSAAFTLVFIAIIVVLNLFVSKLTTSYDLTIDLTETGVYEITQQTKDMLGSLDQDMKITVLENPELFKNQYMLVADILDRYVVMSGGRVSLNYIDPDINLEEARKFETLGDLQRGNIIVEAGRALMMTPYELYATQTIEDPTGYYAPQQQLVGFQGEQKLTSAISYAISTKATVAVFASGHGETVLPELEAMLKNGNFSVETLDLSLKDAKLPDETSLLIIAAPLGDYTETEIKLVDEYMKRGGNVLFFTDFQMPELPVFDRFLAEWGIRRGDSLIFDGVSATRFYSSIIPDVQIVPEILPHAMTELAEDSNLPLLAAFSTPLEAMFEQRDDRYVTPVLESSGYSYSKRLDSDTIEKADSDPSGPFSLALYSERIDDSGVRSGLFAAQLSLVSDPPSSLGYVASPVLTADSKSNSRLMLGVIKYLSPEAAEPIMIEPRSLLSPTMSIESDSNLIILLILLLIPMAFLALALVIWSRRRKL